MNANGELKSNSTVQKNIITNAAAKCILHKGVSGSSMKEIQNASGMGAGQIYRHFRSKMKIVESVVEKNVTEQCDLLPIIYSYARNNIFYSLCDIIDNNSVLQKLKLNIILRVESMTHPELKEAYMRGYQVIENEHIRLLSQLFPELSSSEKVNLMTYIDVFLLTWGGMDSIMLKGDVYREGWLECLKMKLRNINQSS